MRGYPCYRDLPDFGLKLVPSDYLDGHYLVCDPDEAPLISDRLFYKNDLVTDGWLAFFNVILRERGFYDCTISKNKTENKGGNNAKENS